MDRSYRNEESNPAGLASKSRACARERIHYQNWREGECEERKMPAKPPRKERPAGGKQEAAAEIEGIRQFVEKVKRREGARIPFNPSGVIWGKRMLESQVEAPE